jgi:hypothetical protein
MVIQVAIVVVQPLLAVPFRATGTAEDCQEWLSYENLDPLQLHSIS